MGKRESYIYGVMVKFVPRFLGVLMLYKYRSAVSLINLQVLLYGRVGMTGLKIEDLLVVSYVRLIET